MGVVRLGSVPLDPEFAVAGDTGRALTVAEPGSPQAGHFGDIARRLLDVLSQPPD
jgi:hypothetical protein